MASCNLGGRLGLGDEKGKEKWGVDGVVVGVVIVVKIGCGKRGRVWGREDELWGKWGWDVEKEIASVGNIEGKSLFSFFADS